MTLVNIITKPTGFAILSTSFFFGFQECWDKKEMHDGTFREKNGIRHFFIGEMGKASSESWTK